MMFRLYCDESIRDSSHSVLYALDPESSPSSPSKGADLCDCFGVIPIVLRASAARVVVAADAPESLVLIIHSSRCFPVAESSFSGFRG